MSRRKEIPDIEILLAAHRAWLAHGYHGSGLRELARDIGFSIASLLHRHETKAKLMAAVLHQCRASWNEAMKQLNSQDIDWEERWHSVGQQLESPGLGGVRILLNLAAEMPSLPIEVKGAARELHGSVLGWLGTLLTEGRRRGEWPSVADPSLHAKETLANMLGRYAAKQLQ